MFCVAPSFHSYPVGTAPLTSSFFAPAAACHGCLGSAPGAHIVVPGAVPAEGGRLGREVSGQAYTAQCRGAESCGTGHTGAVAAERTIIENRGRVEAAGWEDGDDGSGMKGGARLSCASAVAGRPHTCIPTH